MEEEEEEDVEEGRRWMKMWKEEEGEEAGSSWKSFCVCRASLSEFSKLGVRCGDRKGCLFTG